MEKIAGKQLLSGTVWAFIDRFGTMFLQFVVNIVLARLLVPDDFGCIGMLAIFIAVSNVLIDGGFTSALIQKKDPDQVDYSTIFYWNLFVSILLYGVLFVLAPAIGEFYHMDLLCDVLRVIGLIVIINSFWIIQYSRLRKQLQFRKLAFANVSSYVIGSIVGITMAYSGHGVWSLVAMQLSQASSLSLLLRCVGHWNPSYCFSVSALKRLFNFGGFLFVANILQEICVNLQGIIIGRKFSPYQMGLYSQAHKLDQVSSQAMPRVLNQVMFPIFSKMQDDSAQLVQTLAKNVRLIAFFIFPLMSVLYLFADPIMLFLFGRQWRPAAPYFQILCLGGFFSCITNINYYAVASVGRSKALFNWSIYKWLFLLFGLLIGAGFWGIYGILLAMVISNVNIYLVNAALAYKYVGYSFIGQMKDVLKILLLAMVPFAIVYIIYHAFPVHFFLHVFAYILLYVGLGWFLKVNTMRESVEIIKSIVRKK